MTAEGTACNGAGEAPKAEFAAEKVAAASPEEKATGEREGEGEDVGGPFVIVNGDSDGLSDRGSDLSARPDEDSPYEEEDVPDSNAGPGSAVGGDHAAPGVGEGASDAALSVSSADGRDRAATEPEGGADEGKGEPSADSVAEVVQQEAAGEEQGVADALAASGSDRAVTGADSDAPAMDSEVDGKEGTREESPAATDVAELVVHEAANAEQDGEDAAAEACGHSDALTYIESDSAVMESEICGEESKGEHSAADVVELVEQGTSGAGALMANGHLCADSRDDSSETVTEHESHADESKLEQNATAVAELVEQDAACGEQDGADALQTNGHIHVAMSAESCIVASESKVHANEMKGQESDQQEEGAPTIEAEVLEGVLEAAGRNCAGSVEEPIEVDASGEPEAMIESVECEATCGILQLEDKMDKDGEGSSCDCTAGFACSNEEVELPMEDGINETVPDVDELEEVTDNASQEIVQGDGLVKDGVSIGMLHSLKSESDPSVESNQEQKVQVEVSTGDEITSESELKADSVVEVNTAAPLLSQQKCDSAVETVEHVQLEAPAVGQANDIVNDVAEAEPEPQKEVAIDVDGVPLQAPAASAASTFHNEPRPIDLVGSDSFKYSSPATELESCDHVHTEDSRSREIYDTTVDQLVSDASLECGTAVADEAELTSETGDESLEKPSDTAANQGVPVALNVDKLVVIHDDQPCSATGYGSAEFDKTGDISNKEESSDIVGDSKSHEDKSEIFNESATCDECSSRIGNEGSSTINEETHKDICSENVKASTKSSDEVETKGMEEHKDDDKHACHEETKIVEDSIELHGDLDNNNTGDAQVIGQQKVYIIKVPRFAGEDLWAKTQNAYAHLDQLTQERDAINIRKQKQKAVCDQYREKLEAACREEREARAAHGDKKNDLNSVRSMIGKLNQANSVEEINESIATKEKIMHHETISLKEEKLLLKDINDLKARRKQLYSDMGSQTEINEAFDQKDHIHERHKTLKKDSDVLFTNLKSLEENTRKIQKSFDDERIVLRKLNEEYRSANEMRQKAYRDWSELKAEPFKKNQYFFMYKDDRKIADDYKSSGDMYGLQLYCNNQIERVMEIWKKNEDFRKQYVEANKVSTLRRLETHDGRRLGPDEDTPVIPSRRSSNPSSSTVSRPDVPISALEAAPVLPPVSAPVKEDSLPVLPPPQISKRAKSKASDTSTQNEKTAVSVSEREDVKQTEQTEKEKARQMEEELELARKAEELARREEKLREERAAAEKERLRLEQKAKAKEAEERKRRKAEKAQERAEFKARKEAEMKEKKKTKKDKKKGATPGDSTSAVGDSSATAMATIDTGISENPREAEVSQQTVHKRISRPAAAIKQLNRVQPMPAPLRNRGKRKMRQYILFAAAVLSVLALFVAGNYIPRLSSLKSLHF